MSDMQADFHEHLGKFVHEAIIARIKQDVEQDTPEFNVSYYNTLESHILLLFAHMFQNFKKSKDIKTLTNYYADCIKQLADKRLEELTNTEH